MSTSSEALTPAPAARDLPLLKSRLAGFLAVFPLGLWTFFHLWNNLSIWSGGAAWQSSVTGYAHPFAEVATGIVVLLPLLIHAVWGIARLFTSRPNNASYGTYDNLRYLLQRAAAIGVLLFIGAHLWLAFIHPHVFEGHAEPLSDIAHEMHFNAPTLIVYLLGTLGVAFHLGNGMSNLAMSWGLASSVKGLKRFEALGIVLFAILLIMSWAVIYGLYQYGALT